jgi:ABC-type Mn2+/Zn2+ transport system permease subunit
MAGLLGVGLAIAGRPPNRLLQIGIAVAIAALIIQVVLGLASMNLEDRDAGDQHVFYGIVISFTLAFAYLYRAQLGKRPSLYYGLLMLFMMGLGIRGIQTFGHSF